MNNGFDFGFFDVFSDEVTKGNPVIIAAAKAIQMNPLRGAFFQAMGQMDVPITTNDFEIYARGKTSRNGTLSSEWDAVATSGLGIDPEVLKGLTKGHVLQLGSEIVIINEVNRANNTISVLKRGDANSTAAVHAANSTFEMIGSAYNDMDWDNIETANETTSVYTNYTQTIAEKIAITKLGELFARKGMDEHSTLALLVLEKEIRIAEQLAMASIRGVKNKAVVDGVSRSMSAGLISQLLDNNNGERFARSYNANGELTEIKVQTAITECVYGGGEIDKIWVSGKNKQIINKFNMANSNLSVGTNVGDHTAGSYINAINFEGLILPVEVDLDMPDDKIVLVKQSDCKKGWVGGDGLTLTKEMTTNHRLQVHTIGGSVGFGIENVGTNHSVITGITG